MAGIRIRERLGRAAPLARRIALAKATWIGAALLVVYAVVGFLVLPYVVERAVPRFTEANLGLRSTLTKVRINPFAFTLEASGFRLEPAQGEPPATFERLFVNFQLSSLVRRAWTFADVEVDGLHVSAEVDREGRFNLAELAERWAKANPARPDDKPPRAILRRIALKGAALTFIDRSQAEAARAKSQAIDLEVIDLATVPDQEGSYTIAAKLPGGGTLSWRGRIALQPIASSGEWRIEGVKPAAAWPFFRDVLLIAEPRGTLDVAGSYVFSYESGAASLALRGVSVRLQALAIAQPGAPAPLLALERIELADASYDLSANELVVPRLALAGGTLTATLSADGALDWRGLVKAAAPRAQPAAKPGPSRPLRARIETISAENVRLQFTDASRVTPVEYTAALQGKLALGIAGAGDAVGVKAEGIALMVSDASVRPVGSSDPLLRLDTIAVTGGRLDTAARSVALDVLAIDGGAVTLTRAADGRVSLLDAFAPKQASGKPEAARDAKGDAWTYAVKEAQVSKLKLAFTDRGYTPALRYDLTADVALSKVASGEKSPLGLKMTLRAAPGGTITGNGTLAQNFTQADVRVEAAGLDVTPLQPLLARHAVLDLKSGQVSADARVRYRDGGKPLLRAEGRAKALNLLVNETATKERFASWKALTADGIALSVSPDALSVKEVRIEEPGAKILIAKDRSVNLTKVIKPRSDAAATPPAEKTSDPFPVRIARVVVKGGAVDFADESLVLPFATTVKSVEGVLSGVSSSPQSRTELKLEGLIAPNGSAGASGSVNLTNPRAHLDINVKFENVEMPPLSPYTTTFAGRKVAAGRLWLDLQYKIADAQLLGENKVVLVDFVLGERVKTPGALDLPLDLAVALLKEPDGRIRLAVPVRGDVDNPKFEYGQLIRDAIATALRRIVTAPFRFIGAIFGAGSGDNLQSVEFEPGSARLRPQMREQLQKLAQALEKRRQLKLVVHGAVARERDARALKEAQLRRAIAAALEVKLAPGEDPGPLAWEDPHTQRALEDLLDKRAGADAADRYAAEYAKKTGKPPRRVNRVLALISRGGGERAFYESLFERLVAVEPLPAARLTELAGERARVIAEFMRKTGLDAARVVVREAKTAEDGAAALPSAKLELEAA